MNIEMFSQTEQKYRVAVNPGIKNAWSTKLETSLPVHAFGKPKGQNGRVFAFYTAIGWLH